MTKMMKTDVYDYADVSELYCALKVESYQYCKALYVDLDDNEDFYRGIDEGYKRFTDELLYCAGCNDNESRLNYVTDLYEWLRDRTNELCRPSGYYDLGKYDILNHMGHIVYKLWRSIL